MFPSRRRPRPPPSPTVAPVPDAHTPRDRSRAIGGILVQKGRLSPKEVEKIEAFARANRIRFGDAAMQLHLLTEADVDMAIAQQFNYPVLARTGEGAVGDDVVAAYEPQSEMVEPLRALRSQLMLRWMDADGPKVLAVVSAERGDGRSWLAANLATVLAQNGKRTLLIDADMRHPRQHEMFNLGNDLGLSALLTGRAGREIVRRIHPHLRLFVLPAGSMPPNPQELLGRAVFDVVLEAFAEQYDVVILDTPSASESADAQILSSRAGAALMVVRRDHTHHAMLTETIRSFRETGVNVIGSVLNEY